jgi:hypothetical protein
MSDDDAWAVITPAGELAWYPLAATREVETLIGGERAPGALDTATVTLRGIPPGRGPLKVLASDVALLFPEDYLLNPVAARTLDILSGGRISQPWRGCVALVEYEADQVTGEVLWPGVMCAHWAGQVAAAVIAAGGRVREMPGG